MTIADKLNAEIEAAVNEQLDYNGVSLDNCLDMAATLGSHSKTWYTRHGEHFVEITFEDGSTVSLADDPGF